VLNIQLETIEQNNFNEIRRVLMKAVNDSSEENNLPLMPEELEIQTALEEARRGIEAVKATAKPFQLTSRKAQVRKAQKELIEKSGFHAHLKGEGQEQHLEISET
jgi:hypothetical protein